MMVRHYARVVGMVLFVLGLGGAFGLWYLKPAGIVLYCFTAAFFFYAGFSRWSRPKEIRPLVGGIGVLYFLSGALLFVAYELLQIHASYYDLRHSILRLTIGILSMLAARYLPDRAKGVSLTQEGHPDEPE